MRVRKKLDFAQMFLYLSCGVGMFCLAQIGNNAEPFAIALFYGMASAGLSPIWSAIFYLLTPIPSWNLTVFLLHAGQAFLLCLGFYINRRYARQDFFKTGFLPLLALSLSLGLFFTFAPFTPYTIPFNLPLTELTQRVLFAAGIFLLSAVFSVAMKALIHKLLKCRLRDDEIVFTLLLFVLTGIGFCRFFSVNAYMGIAFFILLLFAYITKDSSITVCAFVLSIPPFLIADLSPTRFFLYGILISLFIKSGKIAAICALLAVFFSFGYMDGLYGYPTDLLVQSLLSVLLPCLFFLLFPTPLLKEMENRLVFYREKHLSRIAINRNRSAIGEQLFEISAVFREIENAFTSLGGDEAETEARAHLCDCVTEEICENCPERALCQHTAGESALQSLIELGCMKGKVSLIDIPRELSAVCNRQSELLYTLNKHLRDYKNYMLEAENAADGRALLANQAKGISEILRNLALEQSEPLRLYTDREQALNLALLRAGIVCSEVLIYGEEDNLTLSLITFGKAEVKKIAAIASHLFQTEMMISERIALSREKFCCVLRQKPLYDAAFGVACTTKSGELHSGDTHSVIKIDESHFLVALSDGMGSGEYAKRISESTISLLESFYRAKMPSSLVLSTVNKLLTFHKEETFACVDIAVVDLNSGQADIVKIGSPAGFILSAPAVKVLENASLPLGILDAIRPNAVEYALNENDILLFISDGIADAFGSTTDLYDVLRTLPTRNPQQMADELLQRALSSYGGEAKDDMTAVAVRLFKPNLE